jgi:hypothetical protein
MSVPTLSKSILTDRNSVYTEQDIIEIFVSPEEVPLLNASQGSYLKFLLKVKDDSNCLAQPDPMGGGCSVIQTISIYDGANSQLLEQLEDVNTWTSMYYHYTKTQGLENMRTLMEGVSPVVGRSLTSQYFIHDPENATQYKEVECVVPLYMSGLLGQGARLLPVIALNGLRIRISLAKKDAALRALTQVGYSSTAATYTGIRQIRGLPVAGAELPEAFGAFAAVAGGAANPAIAGIELNTVGDPVTPATIQQALADFGNVPWCVGQDLYVEQIAPDPPLFLGTITNVTSTGVLPLLRPTYICAGGAAVVGAAGIAASARMYVDANSLRASFEMKNVEFVCSVVQASGATMNGLMKQVSSGGGIRIDYPSYNLYRQNLQAGIPRSELLIPANERRACSILSQPMRSVNRLYEDTLRPVGDALQSYIWNIANRLTPNRRVSTRLVATANEEAAQRLSWDAIHLHETEKAVSRLDIQARNLCENARCLVIPRQLAKDGHSFNANENEIRLNVEYGSSAGENVINKLVGTWLYHIRTCVITPNSVAVEF